LSKHTKLIHVVLHTHWDREWYQTFETFRFHLVRLIDSVLESLEKEPQFIFLLDGQTIVLKDYLQIKLKNKERLVQYIQEGRLQIGPWYVLADEFLVSGEALIRNLLAGKRMAESFGPIMKVGYVPDAFGHIAQLPQILKGFDIESAILWRGLSNLNSELYWQSPDGSNVLLIHLPERGYCMVHPDLFAREGEEAIIPLLRELDERHQTENQLLLYGGDHLFPDPMAFSRIEEWRKINGKEFVISDLKRFCDSVQKQLPDNIQTITGELRDGFDHAPLLQGVSSTRVKLKQENARLQMMLERIVEPLLSFSMLRNEKCELEQIVLHQAWESLLENHPHDSICGCHIDTVADEMMARYKKTDQFIRNLIDSLCPQTEIDADSFTIFNPCTEPRTEPIEAEILRTDGSPFIIQDMNGKEIDSQILSTKEDTYLVRSDHLFPRTESVIRYHLLLAPDIIQPFGFQRFKIQKSNQWSSIDSKIQTGRNFIENKFLRIDVHQNGSLVITDKVTKQTYPRMHVFEDSGDVGDTYNFQPPVHDRILKSTLFKTRISVIESGPHRGALRIRIRMKVPSERTKNRKSRSAKQGMISIWTTVRLAAGSRFISFETIVENGVKDHRLRVLFPTGCSTSTTYSRTPFHVTERKHENRTVQNAKELPVGSCPMTGSVTVMDAQKAVSLFVKGLYEYELKMDNDRTLALTILRGVGCLSRDDLALRPSGHAGPPLETKGAQDLGRHVFEYGIYFHEKPINADWSEVFKVYDQFTLPVLAYSAPQEAQDSILKIQPDSMQLTALKPAEDGQGVILRLLNTSSLKVKGQIVFQIPIASVQKCPLNESEIMTYELKNKKIHFNANPWELLTFRILPI